jgi:hypothetical protein
MPSSTGCGRSLAARGGIELHLLAFFETLEATPPFKSAFRNQKSAIR